MGFFIISKIDTTIRIPANFKHLTGKQPIEITLKAEEPTEVPENVLEYYTKHRSHVFRKAGEPKPEELKRPTQEDLDKIVNAFDPVGFIGDYYENIEDGLESLEDPIRPKLFEIAKTLKLNAFVNQKNERIKERIIEDIKAKMEQEAKLNKK